MTAYASSAEQWASMSKAEREAAMYRLEQREDERDMLQLLQAIQRASEGLKSAKQIAHLETELNRLEYLLAAYINIKKRV